MNVAFDLSLYLTAMAAGTPILFVVWGLVEIIKRLKKEDGTPRIQGDKLMWISLGIGFILGNGYMIFATPPPSGDQGWHALYTYIFANQVWAVGLGILASLFHDSLRKQSEGAVAKIAEAVRDPTAGLP